MAAYTSQQDIPQYRPARTIGTGADANSTPAGFTYRGQYYDESAFRQQFPQQYGDWQKASGSTPGVPAGQAGSPYPSTLPATSFDAAVEDVKKAAAEGNAANQKRYNQLLSNTSRRLSLIDSSFAGINSRTAANNAATDAELGGAQTTLQTRADQLGTGYDQALNDVASVGQRATEEVTRQQASADATSNASLRSRGLGNTTVIDAGRRRNAEVGNRGRADVAEGVATLRSGIRERGATAKAGAYGDLAQFQTNRALVNQQGRTQQNTDARDYLSSFYQGLSDRAGVIERRTDNTPSAYDVATLIGNHEVGQQTAAAQRDASSNQLLGSILGGVGTLAGAFLSDRRAKTNIRKVGTGPDGNTVYRWKYTDALVESGKAPAGEYVGPMAQDVAKTNPSRVTQGDDGYLRLLV